MLQEDEHGGGAAGNQVGDLIDCIPVEPELARLWSQRADLRTALDPDRARFEESPREESRSTASSGLNRQSLQNVWSQIRPGRSWHEQRIDQPDRSTFVPPAKLIDDIRRQRAFTEPKHHQLHTPRTERHPRRSFLGSRRSPVNGGSGDARATGRLLRQIGRHLIDANGCRQDKHVVVPGNDFDAIGVAQPEPRP